MKAAALVDLDSGLALHDLPAPEPGDRELLVRVRAASLNRVDVLIAAGLLRGFMEYVFPVIPGRDFAGVVERTGPGVAGFAAGDEVLGWFTFPVLHVGSWAEYVVIAESGLVAHKPPELDFVRAAALPLAGMTGRGAIDAVAAAPGTRVLVAGAGGGVGVFALQLAAHRDAHVIATARPGDERRLRALGAAETVDYTADEIAAVVRERYPAGIDGLVDLVSRSAEELAPLAALVRDGGRVVSTLGAAAIDERGLVATNLMAEALPAATLAELAELAASGALEIPIDAVFRLEDAAAAIDAFTKGARGKIVLTVGAP